MATATPTTHPAGDVPDWAASKPLVGIDAHGSEHRFDWYRDTVYVIDTDGTLEHVEELPEGALPAWVDYVDETRGWDDLRFREGGPITGLVDVISSP